MKKQDFKNKVVIITGSSRGIGKATAIEFARRGAKVVINGRNQLRLTETQLELKSRGFNVMAIQGDITSVEDCKDLVYSTISRFGRIDVLVNNASLTMNEHVSNLNPSIFNRIFLSNTIGSTNPTIAALPHLQDTKGSVLFISSLAGLHGLPKASAYCTGKMALTAFWQSLKIELGYTGMHFGICYVSFTENDAEKRMIVENGELSSVPRRRKFIQQSQAKVARSVVNMVKRRRAKKILSPIGKTTALLFYLLPRISLFMISTSEKIKAKRKLNQQTISHANR